ncbi:gliding motility lipoprotein GldJ [Flavobacteriales bacterium]|nr:gliding motility lipoprotein GldJ [Flavobacteriales bacterium]
MTNKHTAFLAILSIFILASCSREQSTSTGWDYNNRKQGGFEKMDKAEQIPGPGLMFVEGGRLTMGRVEEDVMYDWNNISKTVTISSFYIDETEVRNMDYVEYLHWIKRHYVNENSPFFTGTARPEIYTKALPDSLVWRDKLGENEMFLNNYLRHPAYREYPVVGVSWEQANDYCIWRTDRVNERILINAGLLMEVTHPDREGVEVAFTTDGYLHGSEDYLANFVTEKQKDRIRNITALKSDDEGRYTNMEDGLLLPNYRLPTEAEWEHAALGYIGNNIGENHDNRKIYPWNGSGLRNDTKKNQGQIMANFKRGRGDNMGVAGSLNDDADITAPVRSYWPNDYGLFNMAGNVSEWVADVYRPITEQTTTSDHRPFRGNVYKTPQINQDAGPGENPYIIDEQGHIKDTLVKSSDNIYRRNYKKANNVNFLDGDIESQMDTKWNDNKTEKSSQDTENIKIDKINNNTSKYKDSSFASNSNEMYDYGNTTLISDRTRVYKGGSWKDRAYWLNPGTRRFLDQSQSTDCIGFRCAMDRVGPSKSELKQNQRIEVDYSKAKQ